MSQIGLLPGFGFAGAAKAFFAGVVAATAANAAAALKKSRLCILFSSLFYCKSSLSLSSY
jgi:hypothetical protein